MDPAKIITTEEAERQAAEFLDKATAAEPVTITCSHCGGVIVTVPKRTADAFASGTWACASRACYDKRTAAEGRLNV